MSTLHIINKEPRSTVFSNCSKAISAKDSIILIENGVHALLDKDWLNDLAQRENANPCYALNPDIEARGLINITRGLNITCIDYREFVELCTQHERTVSWL